MKLSDEPGPDRGQRLLEYPGGEARGPIAPLALWSPRLIAGLTLLCGPLAGALLLLAAYRGVGRPVAAVVAALLGPAVLVAAAAATMVTLTPVVGMLVVAGGSVGLAASALGGYGRAARAYPATARRSTVEACAFALIGAFATAVFLLLVVVHGAGLAAAAVR